MGHKKWCQVRKSKRSFNTLHYTLYFLSETFFHNHSKTAKSLSSGCIRKESDKTSFKCWQPQKLQYNRVACRCERQAGKEAMSLHPHIGKYFKETTWYL